MRTSPATFSRTFTAPSNNRFKSAPGVLVAGGDHQYPEAQVIDHAVDATLGCVRIGAPCAETVGAADAGFDLAQRSAVTPRSQQAIMGLPQTGDRPKNASLHWVAAGVAVEAEQNFVS